jgi:phosphosulfolactate phosphohydrolase-like enzyme
MMISPATFISDDYGQTWTSIVGNVPVSPVNVTEDNINENILYLGTDNGLYVL